MVDGTTTIEIIANEKIGRKIFMIEQLRLNF